MKKTDILIASGEKITNGFTGLKKVDELDMFVTTDKNNLYGLADKDQKVIVPNSYLYVDYAFDGYFVAYKEGEGLGIIDKDGKVVIDFGYDILSKVGDKKFLKAVNMDTKTEITTIFSEKMQKLASLSNMKISIADDHIEVYNNEEKLFIDNNGEIKTAKEIYKDNKLFAEVKDAKWVFKDSEGNIKVECEYEFVTEFNRFGFAGIKKDGKWGIIGEDGNVVCEPVFEFEENGENAGFLGKYYKNFKENNEAYYTDKVTQTGEGM